MCPVSVYFNNYNAKNEQELYEELIGEVVQTWGIDTFYLPRTSESSFDLIYGDDPTKLYASHYPIEMYIKNVDQFEGEDLFTKFGIEVRKQVRLIVPNRAFKKQVPSTYTRPREGDLVWMTNFRALFEIKFVNEENFYYAFGSNHLYGYELICEKFIYSDEVIDVGVDEISKKVDSIITSYNYNLYANGTGTFINSEQVYQGSNLASAIATAEVVRWNKPSLVLTLKNIEGSFANGGAVIGVQSNAVYTINTSNLLQDTTDQQNNNQALDIEAQTFLDFSENNPFGQP